MNQPEWMDLTAHGKGGFGIYRVPGIVCAPNGDSLVYYEGRGKNPNRRRFLCRRSRGARQNLRVRRSQDGG